MPANASPFLVLWYLFLAFFGAVLVVHIICKLASGLIGWRVNVLLRTRTKLPAQTDTQTPDAAQAQKG